MPMTDLVMKISWTIFLFLSISCPTALAEQITLTTYYPAPFGAYDRIKLVPRESLPMDPYCDDESDVGIMYFDDGKGERVAGIYTCHFDDTDQYQWIYLSRPFRTEESQTEKVLNAKVVCVKENGKFGVCINNQSFDGTCACK